MKVQSYLSFEGRCDEALGFYKKALGAEVVQLMRYSEAPAQAPSGNADDGCGGAMPSPDKVMHAVVRIGETELMASDGRCSGQAEFKGVMLALTANTDAEARQWFDALADGGQVMQPLMKTFFTSSFGMLNDRFGVSWLLVVQQAS
ncbi:PhnB protein [Variovorax sp. OK605]|jgi:PhnB protein|uniref:VOC family protein n=1 Tax=unclassified Variovorax TaxID=663243 RepID=UPI0008C3B3DB|nr:MULTISPECIES: VOC family protein [unclassified Variovorax]SEK15617.1 PhnB protein [Variovorax sp. OK202]SFE18021.1 PhnB protein [Variovorax sp. OK212]SFQ44166.1 PhnB protein [Variovorax sp. OK605]